MSCISSDVFKTKLYSHNVISSLEGMKKELEKLNEMERLSMLSSENSNLILADKLNNLNDDIVERFIETKNLIQDLSKKKAEFCQEFSESFQEFSEKVDKLKQSKPDKLLQQLSALITLINFAVLLIKSLNQI